MTLHWLTLIGALIVLGFSAHFLVHSAVKIAKMFKIPELLIGLTLVSLGTSAPEIAVSVTAAIAGEGAISVGNVIGSNIFNLGFVLGFIAIVANQTINKKIVYRDGMVLLIATLLVLFMVWDNHVLWWEGATLLGLMGIYLGYLVFKKDIPTEELEEIKEQTDLEPQLNRKDSWFHILIFLVSLYFLVKSSDWTVEAATAIATAFGISEWAIGVTIIAAGTSLPEVATSIVATLQRKFDIAVGNVIGSDIFNTLGVIGISAIVAPITLESKNLILGLPDFLFSQLLLVATLLLTLFFMRTRWTLSRTEGIVLLTIACSRMGFEIWLGIT